MRKILPSQYEVMVEYMEKNGDLHREGPQDRVENFKRWNDLTELLNNVPKGEQVTIHKWRKAWSDLKNNTKRKIKRLEKDGPRTSIVFTPLEQRVIQVIENTRRNAQTIVDDDIKEEGESDDGGSSSSAHNCAASDDDHDYVPQSAGSSDSSRVNSPAPVVIPVKKRKKSEQPPDRVKELTSRFIDYEKERDKLAHEQEMARITQNEKLLSIMGRMVNVLETLAPSIQKYLDHSSNGDG